MPRMAEIAMRSTLPMLPMLPTHAFPLSTKPKATLHDALKHGHLTSQLVVKNSQTGQLLSQMSLGRPLIHLGRPLIHLGKLRIRQRSLAKLHQRSLGKLRALRLCHRPLRPVRCPLHRMSRPLIQMSCPCCRLS